MRKLYLFLLFLVAGTNLLFAQAIEKNVEERLNEFFSNYTSAFAKINPPSLKSINIDFERKQLRIDASESFAYQPFLPETVEAIYEQIENLLPGPVRFFRVTVYADGRPIEDLVPNAYRKKKKDKDRLSLNIDYKGSPWVKNISRPYEISKGLQNRHIALWQSHGQYLRMIKGNGAGNVPGCSVQQKICLPSLLFFLM